jgi:hypothetical protein
MRAGRLYACKGRPLCIPFPRLECDIGGLDSAEDGAQLNPKEEC